MKAFVLSTTQLHGKFVPIPCICLYFGKGFMIEFTWIQFSIGLGWVNTSHEELQMMAEKARAREHD